MTIFAELLQRRPRLQFPCDCVLVESKSLSRMIFMNRTIPCLAALFMLMAVGCSAPKESFDITVTNRLAEPVTVWLTKADGPYQEGWMPPEEVAAMSRATDHLQGAIVIQPG